MIVIDHLRHFITGSGILLWLTICFVGWVIETLAPAKNLPARDILTNVGYLTFWTWFGFVAMPILGVAATVIVNSFGGGLIELPSGGWPLLWSAALYIFVIDFLEYAFHRAQHTWPFLWAMHSLHHSDRSLNITTTLRHFWLEMPIKVIFLFPIAAIIFKVPDNVLKIYLVSAIYNFFSHMNIKLSIGRLWMLINHPQYHRIHHSALAEHRDRNFSAIFPIFDVIFGTYYRPRPGEYPPTGLDTGEAPNGVFEAVTWPFRNFLRLGQRTG